VILERCFKTYRVDLGHNYNSSPRSIEILLMQSQSLNDNMNIEETSTVMLYLGQVSALYQMTSDTSRDVLCGIVSSQRND
jgi:hypothetical protein